MLLVLSPSKTLDFETPLPVLTATKPQFETQTHVLVKRMAQFSVQELQELMALSPKLAALNNARYLGFAKAPQRPALFAFKGDVYEPLELEHYGTNELAYATTHVRMLSGLYGLLRPFDAIAPHRLEMGTNITIGTHGNLYEYWGETITQALNKELATHADSTLVNLASKEYFSAVKPAKLKGKVLHITFKEIKDGRAKTIGLYAKQARGLMANFAIRNHLTSPSGLQAFNERNYCFNARASTENEWVFARVH